MKNKEIKRTARRLDAIEIAALLPEVRKMYLVRLKRQRPNVFKGVLRLVAIEETRALAGCARKAGKQTLVNNSIALQMEKVAC